jgi:hypothetical protein
MSHDICTSGRNETRLIKNKRVTRILFSRHELNLRLQAIKVLASLTHPLKRTKGQSIPHPITHHDLLLVDIRFGI